MYRNLSSVTSTSVHTLNIDPVGKIKEESIRLQNVTTFGNNSEEAVSESSEIFYEVTIPWDMLRPADSTTIQEFFFDQSKANGIKNSFKWVHPRDGHTYIAKFKTNLTRKIMPPEWYRFNPIVLLILGVE